MQKDFFSNHSSLYAAFRPTYPEALYEFILKHVTKREKVWDCATGNGQVARHLAAHFKEVFATDLSQSQLDYAVRVSNISYDVCPAEKTFFNNNEFDLITVGQALHWFNIELFYKEVKRVGKLNSILAIWGYERCSVNTEIDAVFSDFYTNIVGPFWDPSRKLIENEYRNIEFPFKELPTPKFEIKVAWTLEHYAGYLSSWSATQKYMKANEVDPLPTLLERLRPLWKSEAIQTVTFPVFLRMGKVLR